MTSEEIYKAILTKSDETHEDPLEYNESAMPNKLIFIGWMMGTGYITVNQTEEILKAITNGDIEEFFQVLEYMDIWFEKGYHDMYKELSKFIGSLESYRLRFKREFE